jgi:hypothetical protein
VSSSDRIARRRINDGPLHGDTSLPIGGIRDGGLNGATDKIEEMSYIKRVHFGT